MTKQSISQIEVKELLHYNPETGIFTWRVKTGMRAQAGAVAGSLNHGYHGIKIKSVRYSTSRLAYLYMTGNFPPEFMDHINHITHDNRWSNLRPVTIAENAQNQSIYKGSKSGYLGVTRTPGANTWRARIAIDGKLQHLGCFVEVWDALCCKKSAEYKHGYHINHGT